MENSTYESSRMDREIFRIGFSVETVSLYLLCCGLADSGLPLTLGQMQKRWNGTEASLRLSLEELARKNILSPRRFQEAETTIFRLTERSQWEL
jgi:hypothetical protein